MSKSIKYLKHDITRNKTQTRYKYTNYQSKMDQYQLISHNNYTIIILEISVTVYLFAIEQYFLLSFENDRNLFKK